MTLTPQQARRVVNDGWAAYTAAGRPYGPLRLGMLIWAEETLGWEARRQLDYALKVESQHLEKV